LRGGDTIKSSGGTVKSMRPAGIEIKNSGWTANSAVIRKQMLTGSHTGDRHANWY
jgi:hypothetical protein